MGSPATPRARPGDALGLAHRIAGTLFYHEYCRSRPDHTAASEVAEKVFDLVMDSKPGPTEHQLFWLERQAVLEPASLAARQFCRDHSTAIAAGIEYARNSRIPDSRLPVAAFLVQAILPLVYDRFGHLESHERELLRW